MSGSGYSPEEMRRYWRLHSRQWQDLDRCVDPEGLTNVCLNGAPLWLNRFGDHVQRVVFFRLLNSLGPIEGLHALDVGCGTGRWTRILRDRGALVTGIDLQPETLVDNQARMTDCSFAEMSADSMAFADESFDLVIAVTVLQHIPYESQNRALAETRRVLRRGGKALLLEATHDRGADMFSNSAQEWFEKCSEVGYQVERYAAYDFAPLLHLLTRVAGLYVSRSESRATCPPVEEYVARFRSSQRQGGLARTMYRFVLRLTTTISYPLEALLSAVSPSSWGHHVGILLRAV